MDYDLTEETLEEGRVALYQLERQLKERGKDTYNDAVSEGSSKPHSSTSDRRRADQVPRVIRLNNRSESLGLTVEELDDRGLLDGGGSVPSYYTAMKHKGRRMQELQPRSYRLQERGKETSSKLLNALLHMLRTLVRRGLPLEAFCGQRDPAGRGLMPRKLFYSMLRAIGLPFSSRELQDVLQHYAVPSSDQADYLTLLKDAGMGKEKDRDHRDRDHRDRDRDREIDLSAHARVLTHVRRMLLDAVRSLNKHQDDVYRMFARWDTQGTGTVTATQFLRVLARLHVALSDQEQDFLVELLDTDAMGRVDFEGLLSFCFDQTEELSPQPFGGSVDDDNAGETVSAVSLEGNNSVDQKSQSSGRRPHTATLSRPYAYEQQTGQPYAPHYTSAVGTGAFDSRVGRRHETATGAGNGRDDSAGDLGLGLGMGLGMGLGPGGGLGMAMGAPPSQRPMTASARVSQGTSQPRFVRPVQPEAQYVLELPDDVIYGEEKYLGPGNTTEHMGRNSNGGKGGMGGMGGGGVGMGSQGLQNFARFPEGAVLHLDDEADAASLNDNTQVTDQDEFNFGSPKDIPSMGLLGSMGGMGMGGLGRSSGDWAGSSLESPSREHEPGTEEEGRGRWREARGGDRDAKEGDADLGVGVGGQGEPNHLVLLASQILTTLREIVTTRYRRGKSLQEIYQHFDRDDKSYFDTQDFVTATADLRIETSPRVAAIAVGLLALDGGDRVCFGEFKVFVLDSDHQLLELNVQEQLAQIMEQKGHEYANFMSEVFWSEEDALNDRGGAARSSPSECISRPAFSAALQRIGLALTSSELVRLVDRFDVQGNEACSVPRFVRMVQSSAPWRHAEIVLAYQAEALREAAYLRQQLKAGEGEGMEGVEVVGAGGEVLPALPEELISMCGYLGIRVLSEPGLLWIAADALKAPLPVSWTAQKDSGGCTYFYNHLSNQSKLEHPLDPHFRKLRDKYRQGSIEPEGQTRVVQAAAMAGQGLATAQGSGQARVMEGRNEQGQGQQYAYSGYAPSAQAQPRSRRPQSALDSRPPRTAGGMGGSGVGAGREANARTAGSNTQSGYYPNFDSKALMGSQAYNRPVSAPHLVNHAPQSRRQEEAKRSNVLLEQVYTKTHHPKRGPGPGPSAVDRALSIGTGRPFSAQQKEHTHAHAGKVKQEELKQSKLSEMFDGNIIEKLDNAIGRR